jgi:hypothetical protein
VTLGSFSGQPGARKDPNRCGRRRLSPTQRLLEVCEYVVTHDSRVVKGPRLIPLNGTIEQDRGSFLEVTADDYQSYGNTYGRMPVCLVTRRQKLDQNRVE